MPELRNALSWHVDIVPQRQAFAGGAFDDMKALKLIAEMYADDAAPWARLNCTLSRAHAPDDDFRSAMVAAMRAAE